MKRFLVLLLVFGILLAAGQSQTLVAQGEKKEDKDKKDKVEKKDKDAKDKGKDKEKGKEKDKPLSDAQKKELEALSGTFAVIEFDRDGKKSPADELKKMKVVQKGATWKFSVGDDETEGKDTVHPDKTPKEIDALYLNGPARDKTVKGIYKIEGDTITYCWAEPGKERPKTFASKADSGLTIMKLKRMKEGEPKDKKEEKKDKDKKEEKKDKDKKDK